MEQSAEMEGLRVWKSVEEIGPLLSIEAQGSPAVIGVVKVSLMVDPIGSEQGARARSWLGQCYRWKLW